MYIIIYAHLCVYIYFINIYIYIYILFYHIAAFMQYVYIYIYIYIIVYILFVHLEFVHLLNSVLFDIDIGILNLTRRFKIYWRRKDYNDDYYQHLVNEQPQSNTTSLEGTFQRYTHQRFYFSTWQLIIK